MRDIINEYANSMFRHEKLHARWLDNCASYLESIFKDSIKDKVVVDYAFGRGNWSLAFQRLGAKKVISIDASIDNIDKFSKYIKDNHILNIEIIYGNFMESVYMLPADIVWVYGILHHIEDDKGFLKKIKEFTSNGKTEYVFYAYNKDSLRHLLVNNSRKILKYYTEVDFLNDATMMIPSARLRCRDDLTAPYIKWYRKQELADTLMKSEFFIKKELKDFFYFLNARSNQEFDPHMFLCSDKKENYFFEMNEAEENTNQNKEFVIVQKLIDAILETDIVDHEIKKKLFIGLVNTYYSNVDDYEQTLVNIFLFKSFWIRQLGIPVFGDDPVRFFKYLDDSLFGNEKKWFPECIISEYLHKNNIRL